ncbi:MAG: pyruvate ferredoxin oxidoreductase, partial [Caldiserica bacterium]|nr:pyruvate ferredoxin oxidoreductase [Caldisericota bacterium]
MANRADELRQELGIKHLLACGHTACAGCGEALVMKLIMDAIGPNCIVANATGCSEIFTSKYPQSAWEVPWVHSLFENNAGVASGIEAALKARGRTGVKVVAIGGDGATADIGMGVISGMWERGHNIMYICLDNEAYMNTGIQRSSLTPFGGSTTTSPFGDASWGNQTDKKDMIAIANAHRVKYVASVSVVNFKDLERKIKKAVETNGPSYIHAQAVCPLGWGIDSAVTVDIAKLAVNTGLFPIVEYENGELVKVGKIKKVP